METIEIVDGVVRLVDRTVVKAVSLAHFKESLFSTMGFETPILPPGTVYFAQRRSRSVYVLEQEPCTRTIRYRPGRSGDTMEPKEYTIPLPWTYFISVFQSFAMEELFVFFRRERVEQRRDELCFAPLPNLFDDGKVCLGDFRFDVTSAIPLRVAGVTGFFWSSIFNVEATVLYEHSMPREIMERSEALNYLGGWSRLSLDEACRVGWLKAHSLGELVERALGEQ
ncbi:MAG: hypothetical protein HYY93_09315 [Planctomycetes bacterium]|nr:hypothetical protein [Planctomycetota bacterium]